MAIKGKGKTRARPVAKAPRAAPVKVKPPLFARRWVVSVVSLVLGLGLAAFAIWVYVGVRDQNRTKATAASLKKEVPVVQAFQGDVNTAIAKVGSVTPGQPPTVFTDLSSLIDSMAKGTVPKGALDTADTAAKNAGAAATAIEQVKLSDQVGGKGFNLGQTTYFFNAQSKISSGLRIFEHLAEITKLAATADKTQMADLMKTAQALRSLAQTNINDGYNDLTQLRASVGLFDAPPGLTGSGSGLPGSGLPGAGS